jgi:Na+-driven multidrug efflux pump
LPPRNDETLTCSDFFIPGVAIGAGWQSLVAFVNIGCYYLVGLPLGAVFGFKLKLNATVRSKLEHLIFSLLLSVR